MKFKRGDRVLMLKHADWKNEATGTIVSVRTVPVTLADGSSDEWYWIEFDELQRDFTDELSGMNLVYKESTVLGRHLRPLNHVQRSASA
jgi:hypothetical protein